MTVLAVAGLVVLVMWLSAPSPKRIAVSFGVATSGVNSASPDPGAALDAYAARVGRMPTVVMWYQTWRRTGLQKLIVPRVMDAVESRGAVPMITWLPYVGDGRRSARLTDIAAGRYDAFLRQAASEAARWHRPFFLRPFHEMNGRWEPWGLGVHGNTAPEFVAAWRHVVTIFRQEGATNVRFVFSPNVLSPTSPAITSLYPGDAWVDWVGLDGYNWGGEHWRSFASIFGASYDLITKLTDRPLMVPETASSERGGDKAQWIQDAFAEIPTRFPRIRVVVWFDHLKERDWRIGSSPASIAAYRSVATSRTPRAALMEQHD